jgi:hypothetical protein
MAYDNANLSKGNVDCSSVETLRMMFKSIVKNGVYFLKLAKKLDTAMVIQDEGGEETIRDLLARDIPIFFALKTMKSKVCKLMVGVWPVLQAVIANVTLHQDATHQLDTFLSLMGCIELTARCAISEANKTNRISKMVKFPDQDMARMFLSN